MKQKLLLLLLVICMLNAWKTTGQTTSITPIDSSKRVSCGSSAEKNWEKQLRYKNFVSNPPAVQFIGQANFPANLIETCGAFRIYYEDYTISPALGFADATLGAARRNTFCAVLNYIQGVVNIPSGVTIDIFVEQSLTSSNPSPFGTGWLANAGPYYQIGGFGTIPGFYGGNVYDHISSGTDPDANNYDAHVQVNFNIINTTFANFPIEWWNDYQNTSQSCSFDLYSVLLHEVTHTMGWLSSVAEDANANHDAICKIANNGFTRFDDLFLYYTNDISTLSFTKVVSNSSIAINPAVNTFSVPLRRSNVWVYNNGAPLNQPVYSGDFNTISNYPMPPTNPNSLMSHLNDAFFSFTLRAQQSPGYQPNYVMSSSITTEMFKREWSLPELRILNQFGYSFNYPFSSSAVTSGVVTASVISNSPPYKTNYNPVTVDPFDQGTINNALFAEIGASNFTITTNNNVPANLTATQLTINLSSDATIFDNESNPISIFPNSLFNIQGCSNGGNNHNCLVLSNNNQTITYTPRPGFRGRAVFGFYLTDGIERGAFKTYSIDVQNINSTYLNTLATVGNNLIMNPNYEEGTEFKLRVTDENVENFRTQFFREGQYLCGTALSDNHFFNWYTGSYNVAGGSVIGNSWKECTHINAGTLGKFGEPFTDFNTNNYTSIWPANPLASTTSTPNARYVNLKGNQNYSELYVPMQSCHRYRFSAEINFQQTAIPLGGTYSYTLAFVQPPTPTNTFPAALFSVPVNVTVTANGTNQWQIISTDFNYCGNASSFLNILGDLSFGWPFQSPKIDNISLIEINPVGAFTASIANSNPQYCSTGCSVLTASLTNPFCTPSYTWMPGAVHTVSASVCPTVTTIYTLTVSDGCTTQTATTTVTVNTTPTVAVSNATICSGNPVTLTASGATTYSWNTGATTASISVTPTVTTIYTVTGINPGNCTNTKTVSVTVRTTPTITAVANPTIICSGQTVTLTSTGATSYTWNPGSVTGASISVTPTTTTIYTVTGTNSVSCTNTKTVSVTVKQTPTVTAIANPTSICVGQTATLTAGGATTYSWSTNSTNTVITVSPTITTVYTATGTTLGCSSTKTVSVLVGPVNPTLTVNSPLFNICGTTSATMIASGVNNYTWTPTGGNTATATVAPTSVTVYTVTGSNGTGCGASTKTVIVSPTSSLCCSTTTNIIGTSLTASVNTSGSFANTVFDVQGVITFTANTTFNNCTLRMKPGALLKVYQLTTLTFTNCKVFSCSELWDGIILQSDNGQNPANIVVNNTTVEDMYNGVRVDYWNNPYNNQSATSIGSMSITASTFNKNYISFQIANSTGAKTGVTPYPFTMKTSTISSNASTTSPGSTLKPSTITSYTYAYNTLAGGASTGTNVPFVNFPRAYTGIVLNNLGSTSPVIIGDSVTTGNTNTFDNMDFGITGKEATAKVHNNYFKNITGSNKQSALDPEFNPPAFGPDEIGIAVAMTHTTTHVQQLTVGTKTTLPSTGNPYPKGNVFEDCNKAIKAVSCKNVYVKGNQFNATATSTLSSPVNTYYYYKNQSAIWVSALSDENNISYNYIRNFANGIYSSHTFSLTTPRPIVNDNDIAAPLSTGYCKQGIQISQVGGANIANGSYSLLTNRIANVYNGISCNGVPNGLNIYGNDVRIESMTKILGTTSTATRTAISLSACQYGQVRGNTVYSNVSPVPTTSTTAGYLTGIALSNSPNNRVECNLAHTTGRDFVFQGGCSGTKWLANTMQNSYRGLEMRLAAVIGQQGGVGTPSLSANTWTTITQHTYVLGTTNVNTASKLYLLAGGNTQPTLNFATPPSPSYTTGPGNGIQTSTTGTSYTCNAGTAQRMANGDNGNTNSNNQKVAGATDSLVEYTNLVTTNENTYEVFPDEFEYLNKQLVYKLVEQDSINPSNGSVLDEFYNANLNTAIDKLTEVQIAISNNDISSANSVNASVPVTNQVEYKHQRANELTLKYMNDRNYTFTNSERSDLYNMASECVVKGYYVVQARNIVDIITNQAISYDDNCEAEANVSRKSEIEKTGTVSYSTFNLFPNPNNGSMQLEYDLGGFANADFKLYDITGKLINSYKLQNSKGIMQMNEQNLHNGIYFYHILVGEKTIKTDKIVIIK